MRTELFIFWDASQAAKGFLYVIDQDRVLKKITSAELERIAIGREVCVVMSAKDCAIHKLNLPRVSAKDLPLVIASMLEDKILGNVADFFSYIDKRDEHDYLVFLWDKQELAEMHAFFETCHIKLATVTLDWFALKPQEVFLMADGGAYVYSEAVQGYLNKSVFKHWFQNYSFDALTIYTSEAHPEMHGVTQVKETFWVWVAMRLAEQPLKDIYLKPKKFEINRLVSVAQLSTWFPKLILLTFLMLGMVFGGFYLDNWLIIKKNQKQLQTMVSLADEDIEFRLTRYLDKQGQKNQFWQLWTAVQSSKIPSLQFENIHYQQAKMKLNLSAPDMQSYQLFKKNLARQGIRIINSELQTEANGIHLILELQGASRG